MLRRAQTLVQDRHKSVCVCVCVCVFVCVFVCVAIVFVC